jgi:hypothetical protein
MDQFEVGMWVLCLAMENLFVYCGLEAVFDGSLGFTSVVLSLFFLLLSLCILHLLRWMDRLNIVKHTPSLKDEIF